MNDMRPTLQHTVDEACQTAVSCTLYSSVLFQRQFHHVLQHHWKSSEAVFSNVSDSVFLQASDWPICPHAQRLDRHLLVRDEHNITGQPPCVWLRVRLLWITEACALCFWFVLNGENNNKKYGIHVDKVQTDALKKKAREQLSHHFLLKTDVKITVKRSVSFSNNT